MNSTPKSADKSEESGHNISKVMYLNVYTHILPALQSLGRKQDWDTSPSRGACSLASFLWLASIWKNLAWQTVTSETNWHARIFAYRQTAEQTKVKPDKVHMCKHQCDNVQGHNITSMQIQRTASPYVTMWLWISVSTACDLLLHYETSHRVLCLTCATHK